LIEHFDGVELIGAYDDTVEALSVAVLKFVEQRVSARECRDVGMAETLLLVRVKVKLHEDLRRDFDLRLCCELH